MYIEISTVGVVAIFFAFLYVMFTIAMANLYLNNPRRVIYGIAYGSMLLALLALLVVLS